MTNAELIKRLQEFPPDEPVTLFFPIIHVDLDADLVNSYGGRTVIRADIAKSRWEPSKEASFVIELNPPTMTVSRYKAVFDAESGKIYSVKPE